MTEQHKGLVKIKNEQSQETTIALNGNTGKVTIGGGGKRGRFYIFDGLGKSTLGYDAAHASLSFGTEGNDGRFLIRNSNGTEMFWVRADAGDVRVYDNSTKVVLRFLSSEAVLYIGAKGNEGDLIIRDNDGHNAFRFNSRNATLNLGVKGNNGNIRIRDDRSTVRIEVMGNEGSLYVRDYDGISRIILNGDEGSLSIRDNVGNERILLDGSTGDIKLSGADCAEEFNVEELDKIDPGTVLVIGDEDRLYPCKEKYDKRVVGVVSGGNGSNPGIILGRKPTHNKKLPIALNGKVYCKVEAQQAPIEVGDLLTTSSITGHAMKADDTLRAFGCVIGKALCPLKKDRGLIPIIVALQ